MEPGRRPHRDGQPPAYVFASPCCGARAVLPAWVVEYARARTGGRLLLECGRHSGDPLRPAGAVPGTGCGQRYVVDLPADGDLTKDAPGRGVLPQGPPRPFDNVRPRHNPGPASG